MTAASTARGKPSTEERFAFGKNWAAFLRALNDERITEAEASLRSMLGVPDLAGTTFLDVGSGSGLFSLAAMRLGAQSVHSFDFDAHSVACAAELKERYYPGDDRWQIERGDVLDDAYLARLGTWDVVYSWGVLHHTGDMWQALANVVRLVAPAGTLFIAIYNDQGVRSERWRAVKRFYNRGTLARWLATAGAYAYFGGSVLVREVVHRKKPFSTYRQYYRERGMSKTRDWIDWIGGYPFEVAEPGDILDFYRQRGFQLERLRTAHGLGCNEYVFRKRP